MKKTLFLFCLSFLLFSCDDKDETPKDLEKPKIESISINGMNALTNPETKLYSDSSNLIEVKFTDNVELSQCSINIHLADDSHDEDHTEHLRISGETLPFSYGPIIKTLTSKSHEVVLEVPISDEVALGEYHLEILVVDKAANSDAFVYTMDLESK